MAWQLLARKLKMQAKWQCSECGRVTDRLAVHHIKPIEDTNDPDEMERRCFDESNCQVLCYQCHKDKHRDRIRQTHAERERQRTERTQKTMETMTLQAGFDF